MIRAASASTAQSAATCSRRMSENEKWPIILIIVRKRLHSCFPEHAANLYLLAKSTRMRPYASYCELQPSVLKREETEIHWIRLTRLIIKEIRKESLFLSRRVCFKKYDKKLIPTVMEASRGELREERRLLRYGNEMPFPTIWLRLQNDVSERKWLRQSS